MTEELGKIEKPEAEKFRQGKRLYLIPLIYSNESAPVEYKEKCSRYWQQVTEQLSNLELKAGKVTRVYHESIFQPGEDGIKAIEKLNPDSYQIAKSKYEEGAILEALEDEELLEETMDWGRCLMLGFMSEKVAEIIYQFYSEAENKRNTSIADKLSQTLEDSEAGLLFIREGHMVQFPSNIEVFSIFPPSLDEIHRWLRDRTRIEAEKASETAEEKAEE